jgi:hypothetical protein
MTAIAGLIMHVVWRNLDWTSFAVYAILNVIVFAPVFGFHWGKQLWRRRGEE